MPYDGPGAKKTDTAYHLRAYPRGVHIGNPAESLNRELGDQRDQARAHTDQDMRPETCRFVAGVLALEAHYPAQHACHQEPCGDNQNKLRFKLEQVPAQVITHLFGIYF